MMHISFQAWNTKLQMKVIKTAFLQLVRVIHMNIEEIYEIIDFKPNDEQIAN